MNSEFAKIKNKTANSEDEHGDHLAVNERHLYPLSLQDGVRLDKATTMYMAFHLNNFFSLNKTNYKKL